MRDTKILNVRFRDTRAYLTMGNYHASPLFDHLTPNLIIFT